MTERRHRTRLEDSHTPITLKDLRDELDDRNSLRKNGHTWKQWATKVFTPERIIWSAFVSAGFLFGLGGEVREFKQSIAAFQKTEPELVKQQQALEQQIAQTAALIQQQQMMVVGVTEQTAATKKELADVSDRVRLAVTRQEFQSALQQQILPRLTRIERAQQTPSLSPR